MRQRVHTLLVIMILCSTYARSEDAKAGLPNRGEIVPGYEESEVRERLSTMDLQAIEGLWSYAQEQMLVAVERYKTQQRNKIEYRMVLVSSEDASLLPGTIMGYLEGSAERNKYRLWLYSEKSGGSIENLQKCVATLDEDKGEMTFTRAEWKAKVRVNFTRFLPNLFRGVTVIPEKKEERLPEGFVRVYPVPGNVDGDNKPIRYL